MEKDNTNFDQSLPSIIHSRPLPGSLKDAPGIQRDRIIADIIGFCTVSGGLFGLLAFAAHPSFYRLAGFFGMVIAWFLGVMVGFCCSILGIPILWSRDLAKAKPIIIWPTGVVIVAMVAHWGPPAVFATPLPFLFFVCVSRCLLPRIHVGPNSCARCGYDIRESKAFGRCPECGQGLAQGRPVFAFQYDETRGRVHNTIRRAELFLLRRPSVPLLFLFLAILSPPLVSASRRAARQSYFMTNIRSVGPNGTADFGRATSFPWERVMFYGPYAALKRPAGVDAASWEKFNSRLRDAVFVDEGMTLLVFLEGDSVVEHFLFGREVDIWDTLYNKAVLRENAKFRIIQASESKHFTLVPLEFQSDVDSGQ